MAQTGFFDTVIANTELTFLEPVKIDDILILKAKTTKLGTTSIRFKVHIFNQSGDLTTVITAVYVGYDQHTQTKKEIPEDIKTLIKAFENDGVVLPLDQLPELQKYI